MEIKKCFSSTSDKSNDYKQYAELYNWSKSLYLMCKVGRRAKLIIYDTENERKEERILDIPEPLREELCIAQLPNGELFCFGKGFSSSGIALIVNKNYQVRTLPSGTPCIGSSGIYFKCSIYSFGGWTTYSKGILTISRKFDFGKNLWINLTPMPRADYFCHSLLFNENILISGYLNKNLLLYSVDVDSFSTIPYDFGLCKNKILINVERLYLIESGVGGLIYESEDEYHWKQISKSIIIDDYYQVYCSYNKGAIYIATNSERCRHFKFDLNQKVMIKLT